MNLIEQIKVNDTSIDGYQGTYYSDIPEYVQVTTDDEGKLIEGIKSDGSKHIGGDLIVDGSIYNEAFDLKVDSALEEIEEIVGNAGETLSFFETIEQPEWLKATLDSSNKILYGVDKSGYFYANLHNSSNVYKTIDDIEQSVSENSNKIKLIEDDIDEYIHNQDKFLNRVSSQIQLASVLGWTPQQTWVYPYYPNNNITPLVFLHISDTHGGIDNYDKVENAITALNVLSTGLSNRGLCASFLVHTGDIKSGFADDDFTYFSNAVQKANKPVFLTIGNHDVGNNSLEVYHSMSNEEIYNLMISPFINSWGLKTDGSGEPHPNGKNYYFKDFTDEKIRFISLYEYDTLYELDENDNTKLKYSRGSRSFSQEQLDWIANSLLTTPAGYGVIIAKHAPENKTGYTEIPFNSYYWRGNTIMQTYVGINIIADIVEAFINGTTITQSYEQTGGIVTTLTTNYDFSLKNENVEFICYVSGHTHCDRMSFLADYPKQLELNIGCDNTHYTWGSDMNQRANTLSNDLINVYCIDRNKGHINIVRIGANISNQMQRRDLYSINYRQNNTN